MFTEQNYADLEFNRLGESLFQTKVQSGELKSENKTLITYFATAYYTQAEATDNGLTVTGRVVFSSVIKTETGVEKQESSVDFTESFACDTICKESKLKVDLRIDGVEKTGTQDGYYLTATVGVRASHTINSVKRQLTGGKGINILTEKETCYKGYRKEVKCFDVEDEFLVNSNVKDALWQTADAEVKEVTADVGSIIVSGNVFLSLGMLPFSENSDILKECREIPFRLELDYDEASADSKVFASASVKKTAIKVYVDEDSGRSTVSSVVTLEITGEAYNLTEIGLTKDAYAKDCQEKLEYESVTTDCFCGEYRFEKKLFGKSLNPAPENSRLITGLGDRITGLSYKVSGEELTVEGLLENFAIFDVDGETVCSEVQLPFSITEKCERGDIRNLSVALKSMSIKLRSGQIEVTAEISVNYALFTQKEYKLLSNFEEGEELKENPCAISVYIPEKDETKWSICKKLRITEEELLSLNEGVEFPINQGSERIVVYRGNCAK